MVIRQQFIESLFCAVVSELGQNSDMNFELYQNLCNAINNKGFTIIFKNYNLLANSNYEPLINEYRNCFDNKQNSTFDRNFEVIRKIGFGGFGDVYEVKCLIEDQTYAIKKTRLKRNKNYLLYTHVV
jgi:hypothetical protein